MALAAMHCRKGHAGCSAAAASSLSSSLQPKTRCNLLPRKWGEPAEAMKVHAESLQRTVGRHVDRMRPQGILGSYTGRGGHDGSGMAGRALKAVQQHHRHHLDRKQVPHAGCRQGREVQPHKKKR